MAEPKRSHPTPGENPPGSTPKPEEPHVGKSTLSETLHMPPPRALGPTGITGAPYVDHGGACDGVESPECFLTPLQRDRLVNLLGLRVVEAEANCQAAIVKLRVDQLIAKDDAELALFASLVLDVLGGHIAAVASRTLKKVLETGPSYLARIGIEASKENLETVEKALGIGDLIKTAIGGAKKGMESGLKAPASQEGKGKRADAGAFLVGLHNRTNVMFQAFREDAPVSLRDEDLIVAFASFDAADHTVPHYETILSGLVDRYLKSGVTSIGARAGNAALGLDDLQGSTTPMVKRHVAWASFVSGAPRELFFVDEGAGEDNRKPIDPEFWAAALERQQAEWNTPPGQILVDDSTYYWDPLRADLARDRKLYPGEDPRERARRKMMGAMRPAPAHDGPGDRTHIGPPPIPDALQLQPSDRSTR